MRWSILGILLGGCQLFGACGDYTIVSDTGTESCGGPYGSFGYKTDRVRLFLSTDSDGPVFDWLGSWQIGFDADLLEPGAILQRPDGRALCSRLSDPWAVDYLTEETADFELEVLQDKGLREDDILDDYERWRFRWYIRCEGLDMTATGVDDIDLVLGAPPSNVDPL